MQTKTEMTFAPGWTQEIRKGDGEREDLLSYISDTHKAIYGFRPRGYVAMSWSMDDLRAEAKSLEDEVLASIKRDRAEQARRQSEMAAHHLAVSLAKKPVSRTFKPFANLKEMLV